MSQGVTADVASSRGALREIMDRYLDAVAANDPSRAPLAESVRQTENGQLIPVGHGLWVTATASPRERYLDVIDVDRGEVATLCLVEELGEPSLLGVRLKADAAGAISEIESLVVRPAGSGRVPVFFEPDALAQPNPDYRTDVPPSSRSSRSELIEIVNVYLDAVSTGDGDVLAVEPHCVRRENGFQLVLNEVLGDELAVFKLNMVDQFNAGFGRGMVNRDRRFIVDEQLGLVFGMFFMEFVYSLENYAEQSEDGWKGFHPRPTTLMIHEAWRISDGRMQVIDALFEHGFYGMTSGWD